LAVVGAVAPAGAGTISQPWKADIHESLATADAFASVGQIQGQSADAAYSASGVYLGDGWVLTAAHVVDAATGMDFTLDGQTYSAQAWAYHADWNPADVTAGADLALVKLSGDVSDTHDTATLYTGTDEVGALGVSVGYGLTGTGSSGYDPNSSTDKRAGTNTIDAVYGDDVLLSDFDSGRYADNRLGSSNPTALEYLIAPGDSGGGMFIYDETIADWSLAGINSFGYGLDGAADSDYGDLSGQLRVSSYDDWITETMMADLTLSSEILSGTYDQAVFLVVPEPRLATWLLLPLLWLCRQRKELA
jgi:hypothetical protein